MTQSAAFTRPISRIHWTARAGFYLPVLFGILLLLTIVLPYAPRLLVFLPRAGWSSFTNVLQSILVYSLVVVPLPALILSIVALFITRRPSWRKGLIFAILGSIMSLILCGLLAVYLYVLCCVQFNFHIVY